MNNMRIVASGLPETVQKYEEALNATFAGGVTYGKLKARLVTDDMILRAAQALAKDSSVVAHTHPDDEWKIYSEEYKAMATVALHAALKDVE